jgi:hypothetical protein
MAANKNKLEGKKMTFTVVTGKEKYTVVDLVTGGLSWFEEKKEAYKFMAYLYMVLGHTYRLEVKA